MFSWSIKWLWAQCLAISAGLFLLGHMVMPGPAGLYAVSGIVTNVSTISRKGLGSFYDLGIDGADGTQHRILLDRSVATQSAVQSLVGASVSAKVNASAEAVELAVPADAGGMAGKVRAAAQARSGNFSLGGAIALAIGIFLGLATLILHRRAQPE